MNCCEAINRFLACLCSPCSSYQLTVVAPDSLPAPTIVFHPVPLNPLSTQQKAEKMAQRIGQVFQLPFPQKIMLKRIPTHIPIMMGWGRGGPMPIPQDRFEHVSYPGDPGHQITKIRMALEHYAVAGFSGTFSVPSKVYNSTANEVKKVFEDVLKEHSKWYTSVNHIREDLQEHPHMSKIHQDFIDFVDLELAPLVKEALEKGFPNEVFGLTPDG